MTFDEVLLQIHGLLQRQGRVSYRALKRRFNLDDAYLEDLKAEMIKTQRLAVDEEGEVLVWTGGTGRTPPLAYTPRHLAEKILTSRRALEGERKPVTVLFCDLANSTPLAERLGPEAMHSLLNHFFELALAEVHRYEGTINQFLGDGFMALFGAWPMRTTLGGQRWRPWAPSRGYSSSAANSGVCQEERFVRRLRHYRSAWV